MAGANIAERRLGSTPEVGDALPSPLRGCASVINGGPALIGESAAMRALREQIRRVATVRRPVLVLGPTGSGKDVVARCVHAASADAEQPFFDLNCGALPTHLIESQLFGYEKGAFTGATHRQEGAFTAARQGTVFLDEIAELPLELQATLLRVLENGSFRPLGATANALFKGRVVAATHANLEQMIAQRRFREDLFYRLNVLVVEVPPLAAHPEDVPLLAQHFAEMQDRPLHFTSSALEMLAERPWPGNVRELRNLIDRLAVYAPTPCITPADIEALPGTRRPEASPAIDALVDVLLKTPGKNKLHRIETAIIDTVLRRVGGSRRAAAKLLGVDRKVVERRILRSAQRERRAGALVEADAPSMEVVRLPLPPQHEERARACHPRAAGSDT